MREPWESGGNAEESEIDSFRARLSISQQLGRSGTQLAARPIDPIDLITHEREPAATLHNWNCIRTETVSRTVWETKTDDTHNSNPYRSELRHCCVRSLVFAKSVYIAFFSCCLGARSRKLSRRNREVCVLKEMKQSISCSARLKSISFEESGWDPGRIWPGFQIGKGKQKRDASARMFKIAYGEIHAACVELNKFNCRLSLRRESLKAPFLAALLAIDTKFHGAWRTWCPAQNSRLISFGKSLKHAVRLVISSRRIKPRLVEDVDEGGKEGVRHGDDGEIQNQSPGFICFITDDASNFHFTIRSRR